MKAEHINPFVTSLASTFRTMLNSDVTRGELSYGTPESRRYPISGVIGLSGKAIGTVVINMSEEVALRSASTMLMDEMHEVNDDVLDAVGELANIIAGQAKKELEEFDLSVSLPNVVTGQDHEIRFPSSSPPLRVPFDTPLGPLELEVGMAYSAG